MTVFYQRIRPLQEPNDAIGHDAAGRPQYAFNVSIVKRPSATLLEELASILVADSVGVLNTNIFLGRNARIPTGAGPYLQISETGGMSPIATQNEVDVPAYPRPSAQIVVHASDSVTARTMAYAAYNSLVAVSNQDV